MHMKIYLISYVLMILLHKDQIFLISNKSNDQSSVYFYKYFFKNNIKYIIKSINITFNRETKIWNIEIFTYKVHLHLIFLLNSDEIRIKKFTSIRYVMLG